MEEHWLCQEAVSNQREIDLHSTWSAVVDMCPAWVLAKDNEARCDQKPKQ